MFFLHRESESRNEEDHLNVEPADETIAEAALDPNKQEKTADVVGFQILCTGFALFVSNNFLQ